MFRNKIGLKILLAIAVVFGALRLLNLYTDWVWFNSVNFGGIFVRTLMAKLITGSLIGLLVFLILYINLTIIRRLLKKSHTVIEEGHNVEFLHQDAAASISDYIMDFVRSKYAAIVVLSISLIFAILSGLTASTQWMTFSQFVNWSSFNMGDPVFGTEIGYYIFRLPFYLLLYRSAMSILFLTTVGIAVAYYFVGLMQSMSNNQGRRIFNTAFTHLSVMGAITFLVKALGYKLDIDQLLYSGRGVAFGASHTDMYAVRPVLFISMGLAVLAAALYLANIKLKKIKLLIAAPALLLIFSVVANTIYPAMIQQFVVTPNELDREREFIVNNINLTRFAYGLDRIQERNFPALDNLTVEVLERNPGTMANIRLHDMRPMLTTLNQIEAIRPYYDFVDVDIDRYLINGQQSLIMLSARELNVNKLESQAQTWQNIHLRYTHGLGAVAAPVTAVSRQGLPMFLLQNVPPTSQIPELEVERPSIYFGELSNHYIITNTAIPEIHYPGDTGAVTTFYEGTDGIPLNLLNRLLYSMRLGTAKMFLSNDVVSDSRLIINRNINQRVRQIAPFLIYDEDPYLVISEGQMYWIIDAYTHTNYFPYSEPTQGGINYLRNSIKVVIDTYNGTTTFYWVDKDDPLAQTYDKIFPTLLTDFEDMPEGLKRHIRYPQTLFKVQSRMLLHYQMTEPDTFFSKEDAWRIPSEVFAGNQIAVEPNYLLMRLPGEHSEEFVLMTPFVPAARNNLVAWLAARNDGENYGELILYQFPRQSFVPGTLTIENRIDQDSIISPQLSLWSQQGSRVIRGNLMVIPIEGSLIYVEPVYLQATAEGLPELARVIVAYGDSVVMQPTLQEALEIIFGEGVPTDPFDPDDELSTLATLSIRAQDVYMRAIQAQRDGNWSQYGILLNELESILNRMVEITDEAIPSVPTPPTP